MKNFEDQFQRRITSLANMLKDDGSTETAEPTPDQLHTKAESSTSSHYEFKGCIAQGGIKKILRMRDCKTGRDISMAMLKEEHRSPINNERFLREARIQASLEHASIVPLHAIDYDENGDVYFTMKILSGETLGSILKKIREGDPHYSEKYSLTELLGIFMYACNAIAYAHSKGIIHLDLKPDNIQITDFNEVYVLDWGFAKFKGEDESFHYQASDLSTHAPISANLTQVGTINGTPGYLSPEQASAKTKDIDHRSDIYSLGSILYTILYLNHPYHGLDIFQIIDATSSGRKKMFPEKSRDETVPIALKAIAEKAMQLIAENRYNTVTDLQNDLNLYLHDYATMAEKIRFSHIFYLFLKRNRKALLITVAVISTISTVSFFAYDKIRAQEEIAIYKEKATLNEIIKGAIEKEQLLRQKRNYKGAIEVYEKLDQLGYDHPEIHFNHALLLAGEIRFKEALAYLGKVKSSITLLENQELYNVFLKETEEINTIAEKRKTNPHDWFKYYLKIEHLPLRDHIIWNTNTDPNISLIDKLEIAKESLFLRNKKSADRKINFNYMISDDQVKLDLSNNPQIDIRSILGLPIRELDISNSQINIEPVTEHLKTCTTRLNISKNTIVFINPNLVDSIYSEIIARNSVYAGRSYDRTPKLKYLDLEGAAIGSIQNIPSPTIEYLNIAYSNFSNFDILPQFKSLKTLVIDKSLMIPDAILNKLKKHGVDVLTKARE